MPPYDDPRQNHQLLAALPDDTYAHFSRHLEPVPMPLGEVLHEPGQPPRYAYFPTTAIVSLLNVMEEGATTAVAVVGYEGVVGISLFMGGETSPNRSVVHSAGHGCRIKAPAPEGRVRPRRPAAAFVAALHPGAADADGADGGVQPPSLPGPAALPLAAAESRPSALEPTRNDAGVDWARSWGAAGRHHRGCRQPAESGLDRVSPRLHRRARSSRTGGTRLRVLRGSPG
jgi:hypothetical protein